MNQTHFLTILFLLIVTATPTQAARLIVGVASSLAFLNKEFVSASMLDVQTQKAATGILYTQLNNGFPLDFFLAATTEHPQRYHHAHPNNVCSKHNFAYGQLALIGSNNPSTINWAQVEKIIIANPSLAPYGKAAKQWLEHSGFKGQYILANNALSVLHLHRSNANLYAITALALAAQQPEPYHLIPPSTYDPIVHTALWLKKNNQCSKNAQKFWTFLKSNKAKQLIQKHHFIAP